MAPPLHIPVSKPVVTGPVNGNIFSVLGVSTLALKRAGLPESANELRERVFGAAKSYDEALAMCLEYVDFDL